MTHHQPQLPEEPEPRIVNIVPDDGIGSRVLHKHGVFHGTFQQFKEQDEYNAWAEQTYVDPAEYEDERGGEDEDTDTRG